MNLKTNIIVDKILKGVHINKNNDVDFTANILVDLDKDVVFEWAIVDEGTEDSFIPFQQAKKTLSTKYQNNDGMYKKKMLMLRSPEKSNASIDIGIDRMFNPQDSNFLETLGPRGTVLLNSTADGNSFGSSLVDKWKEGTWYKDPIIISIIVGIVLVLFFFIMSRRKRPGSSSTSIFAD